MPVQTRSQSKAKAATLHSNSGDTKVKINIKMASCSSTTSSCNESTTSQRSISSDNVSEISNSDSNIREESALNCPQRKASFWHKVWRFRKTSDAPLTTTTTIPATGSATTPSTTAEAPSKNGIWIARGRKMFGYFQTFLSVFGGAYSVYQIANSLMLNDEERMEIRVVRRF